MKYNKDRLISFYIDSLGYSEDDMFILTASAKELFEDLTEEERLNYFGYIA